VGILRNGEKQFNFEKGNRGAGLAWFENKGCSLLEKLMA
jgi:hypothetical protein